MARPDASNQQPGVFALASGVATVAILYFAREVLLPFAMALLLSFLLAPMVERLKRWHVARIPAVLIAVGFSLAGIGGLGYILFHEIYELAYRLPEYELNITKKVQALHGNEQGVLARISTAMADVRTKLAERPGAAQPPTSSSSEAPHERNPGSSALEGTPALVSHEIDRRPTQVEIVKPLSAAGLMEQLLAVGPWITPFGTAVIVIVFAMFMLIEREDLRNRLIYLIGSDHLNNTTIALDAAARRVSRYLRMQLVVNALFGIIVAIGLFFIGVPNPLLWGSAAVLLRFAPFVGPIAAAIVPLAISLAVFDGWTQPICVVVLYAVGETVVSNAIEPRLIASSTGISALGILVSTVVWLWLWGPIGLILATPVTVCLAVLVGYVPRLDFLRTLLSDDHLLPPAARFYQRLLASDPDEALDIAEDYLKHNTPVSLYDTVLVPALQLAEQDRHRGHLHDLKQTFINRTVRDLIEDIGTRSLLSTGDTERSSSELGDSSTQQIPVAALCLPARDEADEIVGLMLAQLLAERGINMQVLSPRRLASEMIDEAVEQSVNVVCVSALPPFATTHARYLCKRLAPKSRHFTILAGLWQAEGAKKAQERLIKTGIAACVTTLREATDRVITMVATAKTLRCAHT